jgi:hypothetical protein
LTGTVNWELRFGAVRAARNSQNERLYELNLQWAWEALKGLLEATERCALDLGRLNAFS